MSTIRTDVAVLGGGPAGAVLAWKLAGLGHAVCILDRAAEPGRRIAETLPATGLPILAALGLGACVTAAAYRESDRAYLLWSHADAAATPVRRLALSIDRRRFDRALLAAARAAGAQVLAPCNAGTPVRTGDRGWRLPAGAGAVETRFLADARGRRARLEGRAQPSAPRTFAVTTIARRLPATGPETCIEACPEGWCWGMALPGEGYALTTFLDAELRRGADLAETHRRTLGQSTLLHGCGLEGRTVVCDATSLVHDHPIGLDYVRTGEAAFAVDPLSSQGVQLAITSALQAAAAVHTILATPAETDAALAFYRERQRDAAERSRRTAASLYAAQDRHPAGAFWQCRAGPAETAPASPPVPAIGDRVRLAATAELIATPVLAGDLIRRAPALSHPALERPLAWLGDAAIAPLLAPLAGEVEVAELLRCWERSMPASTARATFAWLAARGIVVPAAA